MWHSWFLQIEALTWNLNRAKNKSNFNITLHTYRLRCTGDTLLLFGDQTDSTKPDDGLINGHFDGYFKELELVSEVVDGEMYQCKFRSTTPSGGSRIFQMGGHCFVANGGAHILFSGKKCMKLKEIGLKWGGARLLAPCYSKITIFLWIILNSIMKTSYFTYLRIFWDILYKIIF